jgi:Skp family chaperone for outer membrane proteins
MNDQTKKAIDIVKIINLTIALVAFIFSLISLILNGSNSGLQWGYIDSTMVLEGSQIGLQAKSQIDRKLEEYQGEISNLEKELEILQNLVNDNEDNSPELLSQLNSRTSEYESLLTRANQEMTVFQNEVMTPVAEKINQALVNFGEANNYDFIFGATSLGSIAFATEELNLTDEFIEYLDLLEN